MKHHRIGKGGTKVESKKAAGILFTDGKTILMLKRAGEGSHSGTWALPGGKGQQGETEIGNAIRETREETGLDTIPGFRFDSVTTKNGHQKFTTFFYRVPNQFDIRISHEHSEWKWVPFDELRSAKLHPKFREALPEYLHVIRKKTGTFAEWTALADLITLFA
jgi:8-oxo-dGTP pyrophosphatase MutT (NUDIX family)